MNVTKLNPKTPLAYVSPDIEAAVNISLYMVIGSLGAFTWDMLTNIHDDYRLLFKHKASLPTSVYFLSRCSVLASAIGCTLWRAFPLGLPTCKIMLSSMYALYHVAFGFTTLLFTLRVRAIYNRNKYVVGMFMLLWAGVLGSSMAVTIPIAASVIGPTDYCIDAGLKHYAGAAPILLLVSDTCVFFAISWHLLSLSPCVRGNGRNRFIWRRICIGRHLPNLSRALFQDGQVYYLISLLANLVSAVTVIHPTLSFGYRFTYIPNALVIVNMMACRVYRRTKLGEFREYSISTAYMQRLGLHRSPEPVLRSTMGEVVHGSSENEDQDKWYRNWRSRILFAVIVVCLPAIFVSTLLEMLDHSLSKT